MSDKFSSKYISSWSRQDEFLSSGFIQKIAKFGTQSDIDYKRIHVRIQRTFYWKQTTVTRFQNNKFRKFSNPNVQFKIPYRFHRTDYLARPCRVFDRLFPSDNVSPRPNTLTRDQKSTMSMRLRRLQIQRISFFLLCFHRHF